MEDSKNREKFLAEIHSTTQQNMSSRAYKLLPAVSKCVTVEWTP
jgi:hypothetical protein